MSDIEKAKSLRDALRAEIQKADNWRGNRKDQKTAELVKKKFIDMISRLDQYEAQHRNSLETDDSVVEVPSNAAQSTMIKRRSTRSKSPTPSPIPELIHVSPTRSIQSTASSIVAQLSDVESIKKRKKEKLSKFGETELQQAAKRGMAELVEKYAAFQCVNHQDNNGNGALHDAAAMGHLSVVKVLTSRKEISVNMNNQSGATPLHLAAEEDHIDVCRHLLDNGANPTLLDCQGRKASDLCTDRPLYQLLVSKCDKQSPDDDDEFKFEATSQDAIVCFPLKLSVTQKTIRDLEKSEPNVKFTSHMTRSTHVIVNEEDVLEMEKRMYKKDYMMFTQFVTAMQTGKVLMDSSYFESLNEELAMEKLNEKYDNGPRKALARWRKRELPILTGFKLYLDMDKARAKSLGHLMTQCGAKMLTRQPKPDNDNVQADDEVVQSQTSFQYTHLIAHDKERHSNPIRRGKVATVHFKWIMLVLLKHAISDPFE